MNDTSMYQEEAIERAEVLTCCHPPAVAAAVQARFVAHNHQYLLHRLDVRQADGAYQLTIHGHLQQGHDSNQPVPLLVEHVTIPATDEDGWVRARGAVPPW